MSKLEELIEKLCPDGVEYVKIKEAFQRIKGTPITAGKMKEIENEDGEIRIFAGGKTVINAKESDIPNANITRVPAVLVQSRGIIDVIYYEKPFTFKNEMWAYTHSEKITVKYLYYVMKNNINHFRESASGMGSLPQISLPVTEDYKFPLPPLEIQEEIVRILDSFTELTAELTVELAARKKQYEYYRDKLLTFGDEVERVRIGDICKSIKDGMHNLPKDNIEYSDYPILSAQNINNGVIDFTAKRYVSEETYIKETKRTNIEQGDVLLTIVATIGRTAIVKENTKMLLQRSVCVLKPKKEILSSFLKYCLDTNSMQNYMITNAHGSAQAGLYLNQVADILIPLPPLEEQERIVSILDRFDKLCNDITEGLPAEIEARQKQYEYYRDKLLSFKEL